MSYKQFQTVTKYVNKIQQYLWHITVQNLYPLLDWNQFVSLNCIRAIYKLNHLMIRVQASVLTKIKSTGYCYVVCERHWPYGTHQSLTSHNTTITLLKSVCHYSTDRRALNSCWLQTAHAQTALWRHNNATHQVSAPAVFKILCRLQGYLV